MYPKDLLSKNGVLKYRMTSTRGLYFSSMASSISHDQLLQTSRDPRETEARWEPPIMVEPDEEMETEDETIVDHGDIDTDAALYILQGNGEKRIHSLIQMPSSLPHQFTRTNQQGVYSAVRTYNILMADTSGSMTNFWKALVEGWNTYVTPHLVGRTELYVFSSAVLLKRSGTLLELNDFEGGATDLIGALQTIVNEVYSCKERYINVFLITDGTHNTSSVKPDSVINKVQAARGKVCNAYVLGAGNEFPVQYSVSIRSRLHNGSSNLPSLFWAKTHTEMDEQLREIGNNISGVTSQCLKLSVAGASLPGSEIKDTFHLKEWVYFSMGPEHLQNLTVSLGRNKGHITLEPHEIPISLLKEVFYQWNSIIIQWHSRKEVVPPDLLPLMEEIFQTEMMVLNKTNDPRSIRQRLARKEMNTYETDFRTLFNKLKAILTTEKFLNDLELAENILSTTVGGGKYNTKVLQMKGHTDKDYENDCNEFMKVYNKHKISIQNVSVTSEDCCRVTLTSTLSDLQDPDFCMMSNLNKFEFLKQFTITGIPVFAPTRDSVKINPWSYSVRALVSAPYSVMSQVAMETYAESNDLAGGNKDIQLKWDDQNTRFNAIVPVFPPASAKVMAPFVHTRLYAMCATFAILKNPYILDFDIHMAALGVTWVRILFEYPTQPRSAFVHLRIESIEATAALYINRPSYTKYLEVLRDDTSQALMSESTLLVDNKTLKCESLIKPMFLLYIKQRCESHQDPIVLAKIVRMMLIEYIGRCLSNYKSKKSESTPFTDFFAETLADQKKELVQKHFTDSKAVMVGSEDFILENFYTLERVQKAAKKTAAKAVKSLKKQLIAKIPIRVNVEKVEQLRNVSGAGDVSWLTLKTYAREVGLTEDVVSDLFCEQNVFVYVAHALMHRASRDRLNATISDYDASWKQVTKYIQEENSQIIEKDLHAKFMEHLQSSWLKSYFSAHKEVVQPMTRQEILRKASQLGVDVTDATFDQVYKRYRPQLGLLSNACQCQGCPYFLIPDKSYNQHASEERHGPIAFPHAFHHTAYQLRDADLPTVVSQVVSGAYSRNETPVPLEAFQNFTDDLQYLQIIYKETAFATRINR